ncbi:MAG: HRDC domain-containing protein [Myxococcota bacterium]
MSYKEYALTELGWQVLRREADGFEMRFPHASKLVRRDKAAKPAAATGVPGDLMAMLRDLRRQLADRRSVPVYVVAPNRTLEDMARLRPTTKRAMLEIHGMGKGRFEQYGKTFMEAIREWNHS